MSLWVLRIKRSIGFGVAKLDKLGAKLALS